MRMRARAFTIVFPPAPGIWCGDSDYTWVSGWYPAATELTILKKAYTSQKKLVSF